MSNTEMIRAVAAVSAETQGCTPADLRYPRNENARNALHFAVWTLLRTGGVPVNEVADYFRLSEVRISGICARLDRVVSPEASAIVSGLSDIHDRIFTEAEIVG